MSMLKIQILDIVMIKKTFLLLLLVVTAVTVRAQGVLEVDDLSQANAVYSSEGEKAAVETGSRRAQMRGAFNSLGSRLGRRWRLGRHLRQ